MLKCKEQYFQLYAKVPIPFIPLLLFYIILSFVIHTTVSAQEGWQWSWDRIDLSRTPGDSLLLNLDNAKAIKVPGEQFPRFIKMVEDEDEIRSLQMIYYEEPEGWQIDEEFFMHHLDAFDITLEDSIVRVSSSCWKMEHASTVFESRTKNLFFHNEQWQYDSLAVFINDLHYLWTPISPIGISYKDIDFDGDNDWFLFVASIYQNSPNDIFRVSVLKSENGWIEPEFVRVEGNYSYYEPLNIQLVNMDDDSLYEVLYSYKYYPCDSHVFSMDDKTHLKILYNPEANSDLIINELTGNNEDMGRLTVLNIDENEEPEYLASDGTGIVQWILTQNDTSMSLQKQYLWAGPTSTQALWCNNQSTDINKFVTKDKIQYSDEYPHIFYKYYLDSWADNDTLLFWKYSCRINEEIIFENFLKPMILNDDIGNEVCGLHSYSFIYNEDFGTSIRRTQCFVENDNQETNYWKICLDYNHSEWRFIPQLWSDVGDWDNDSEIEIIVDCNQSPYTVGYDYNSENEQYDTFEFDNIEYGRPYLCDLNGDGKMDLHLTGGPSYLNVGDGNGLPELVEVSPFDDLDPPFDLTLSFDPATFYSVIDWQADGDADFLLPDGRLLINDSEVGICEKVKQQPTDFRIQSIYPNPFNSSTVISVTLPQKENLSIDVFNVLGQKIQNIFDNTLSLGNHRIVYKPEELASGIYFLQFKAGSQIQIKKVFLLK